MEQRGMRRLFFWLCFGLFFISAPLAILYTVGYRWSSHEGFVRTGTLYLATTPKGAEVSLNGRLLRETSPVVIKTLTPGTYAVRAELKDHQAWEQTVTIHDGKTTFLDTLVLFSLSEPELYLGERMNQAAWSPDGTWIAWTNDQKGWTEIWTSPISAPASRLIARVPHTSSLNMLWTDRQTLALTQEDETTYIRSDGTVLEEPPLVATAITLEISEQTTRVLTDRGYLATLPGIRWEVRDTRGPYILLHDSEGQHIALLTQADPLAPLLLLEPARDARWFGQEALLFRSTFAIHVYEPTTHEQTLITRISEPLQDAIWYPSGAYVLYATDTSVFAIARKDTVDRVAIPLGTFDHITGLQTDTQGRELYLIATHGFDTGLFRRTLWKNRGLCLPGVRCL